MTIATLPAAIAADLRAHGIDPAAAEYRDTRSRLGNGATGVRLPGSPVREAQEWEAGVWALKVGGRFARNAAAGDIRLYPSAGAALAAE